MNTLGYSRCHEQLKKEISRMYRLQNKPNNTKTQGKTRLEPSRIGYKFRLYDVNY